jgi:VanZ family protein
MAIIFTASSDQGSFRHSSRIIAPVLLWLFPHLDANTVHAIVVGVRKCAHLAEYAILAVLIWRALSRPIGSESRCWRWRQALQALLVVALYAASDEFHQPFVPTREASILDVLIDTTGAAVGLLVVRSLWYLGERRKARMVALI